MRRPDLDGQVIREKILWSLRLHRGAGLIGIALNAIRFDPNLL